MFYFGFFRNDNNIATMNVTIIKLFSLFSSSFSPSWKEVQDILVWTKKIINKQNKNKETWSVLKGAATDSFSLWLKNVQKIVFSVSLGVPFGNGFFT